MKTNLPWSGAPPASWLSAPRAFPLSFTISRRTLERLSTGSTIQPMLKKSLDLGASWKNGSKMLVRSQSATGGPQPSKTSPGMASFPTQNNRLKHFGRRLRLVFERDSKISI